MIEYLLNNFLFNIFAVWPLDCYNCYEVEWWNQWTCTQSIETCVMGQDTCATLVRYSRVKDQYWGRLGIIFLLLDLVTMANNLYFFPIGFRRHYITKGCTSFSGCSQNRWTVQQHCRRAGTAFYGMDDWTCVDCCQSGLCNYWVNFVCYQLSTLL